jgi:succinate dehydrogenase/fumarate reductase flavoprotein subunit
VRCDAPLEADVVVVGGGVAGCSLLYQLAKQGVTNTVLVEKDQLTAGTTWHTAGEGKGKRGRERGTEKGREGEKRHGGDWEEGGRDRKHGIMIS